MNTHWDADRKIGERKMKEWMVLHLSQYVERLRARLPIFLSKNLSVL